MTHASGAPPLPADAARLVVLDDAAAVAAEAQRRVVAAAGDAIGARGRFTLAVSGGSTPEALYRRLADPPTQLDWTRAEIFLEDERCVPPDHADSNYGMLARALLSRVPVPAARVHRMKGEAADRDAAAAAYAAELTADCGAPPVLDYAILGLGPDAHMMSLFPGGAALREATRLCVVVATSPTPPHVARLTLTVPALERTRAMLFLVTGSQKATPLAACLAGPLDLARLPGQRLMRGRDAATRVVVLADRAAAALLPPPAGAAP